MRPLVAAVVAALLLLLSTGCGLAEPDRIRISAQFRDSVGLYVGNDVAVLGIPVGTVTRIEPRGTHVLVELAVDADTPIPADAAAVTLSPSLVTDRRVELTPAYTGGPRMRSGDLIPIEHTRTPVEIDRVLAAVDELAGELAAFEGGSGALSGALGVSADTLRGNGEKLRRALSGVADAVAVGVDQRDALRSLIRNVDQLTAAAAGNDATIRSFSTRLTEATELFDEQSPALVQALGDLTALLDDAERLIVENRGSGEQALANLRVTTETLAERRRELAESADVLPTLFNNLSRVVDAERGRARVHVSLQDVLINPQLIGDLCARLSMSAPGCTTGRLADFGPDLGLTEALLGATR